MVKNNTGFSFLEIIVTLGVVSLLAGLSINYMNSPMPALDVANAESSFIKAWGEAKSYARINSTQATLNFSSSGIGFTSPIVVNVSGGGQALPQSYAARNPIQSLPLQAQDVYVIEGTTDPNRVNDIKHFRAVTGTDGQTKLTAIEINGVAIEATAQVTEAALPDDTDVTGDPGTSEDQIPNPYSRSYTLPNGVQISSTLSSVTFNNAGEIINTGLPNVLLVTFSKSGYTRSLQIYATTTQIFKDIASSSP